MELTRVCFVAIFLSDLSIIKRVSVNDAADHAIILGVLDLRSTQSTSENFPVITNGTYLCTTIHCSVVGQCNLTLQINSGIGQDLEVRTSSTAHIYIFCGDVPTRTHSMIRRDEIGVAARVIFGQHIFYQVGFMRGAIRSDQGQARVLWVRHCRSVSPKFSEA